MFPFFPKYAILKLFEMVVYQTSVYAQWCSCKRVGLSMGWSEDWRVGGSRLGWCLHFCVVSLDKKLSSTLPLFTRVYTADIMRWTSVSSKDEHKYSSFFPHAIETGLTGWFVALIREDSLRVLLFSLLLKNQHF